MSDYLRVGNVLGAAWHAALGPVRGRHGFGHHAKGTEMHAVRRLFVVTQIIRFQSQVRVVHDAMAAGRAACPAHGEFSRGYGHKHGWGRGRSWRHRAAASSHRRQASTDDMVVGIASERLTGDCKTCLNSCVGWYVQVSVLWEVEDINEERSTCKCSKRK